jgi:UDP-2-acetamido-2,6-beta-L-arabino-hexul-4-ose reductase
MSETIVVTGADGFIGRNLVEHLRSNNQFEVRKIIRDTTREQLSQIVRGCDAVIHTAGANRPQDASEFVATNVRFTEYLLEALENNGAPPVFFTSSKQASSDNPYGRSKSEAERLVAAYGYRNGVSTRIVRLPNIFGKWSRPDYNSVIATFAHNIARGLPIRIDNPNQTLELVYIDDLVKAIIHDLLTDFADHSLVLEPVYRIAVADAAKVLQEFHKFRRTGHISEVGVGIQRALYATYISFLEPLSFSYPIRSHVDERGSFVEFIKTPQSGQISFLTAKPGATRGSHYHHTKVEKFIVTHGKARFRYRNLKDGTLHQVDVTAAAPTVVESVPGWIHDITNTGDTDLSVLIWANELFDPSRSDTFEDVIRH